MGIDRLNYKKLIIFIIFFLQTISFVQSLNITNIKYISMFLLNGLIIFSCLKNGIKKTELLNIFIILIMFFASSVFQFTSFSQKITSMIFYITLLIWTMLSYRIVNKREYILYSSYGIIIAVILGLALTFNEVIYQLTSIYNSRNRLWGGFSHPNNLGAIISTSIIGLYTYNFLYRINKKNRKFYLIAMISLIILLYCTKSRTSWIVTIVAIVIMNLKHVSNKDRSIKFVLYCLLFIGAIYIGYFFATEYALKDEAFVARLKIFDTMAITPRTFLVGNGMVNAANLNRANTNGGAMEIAWVMLFYKNGIIGILSFITIILVLLLRATKVNNKNQVWAFRGILIAFMIGTLGESYMVNITNVPALFNWVMLSVLSSNSFNRTNIYEGVCNENFANR